MVLEPTITNSYSMDIIIKICGTLTTFIIFLFISAWHLTRRVYKLPQFVQISPLKEIKDLTNFNFLNSCYKESKNKSNYGAVAVPFTNGKMAIIINDINWCFNHKPNLVFTVPFSLVPKCITKSWKGILFSHDSAEADVLRCLIVKSFDSIEWSVIEKAINFGIRFSDLNEINVETSAQLISFESLLGYSVYSEKLESKLLFITKVVNLSNEFSDYYYHGKLSRKYFGDNDDDDDDDNGDSSTPSAFIETINQLLNPVVESAIFHSDSQYSNAIPILAVSENILSQLVKLRHHLREENVDCNLLSIDNFSHVIFEHYFILNNVLNKCLQGAHYLCSVAPNIIFAIKKEIEAEACVEKGKSIKLLESHLESSISLVYTKSVVQELMRHLAIGIDFDLSITERDGSVGEFDFLENSIIVLNHFAFSRDRNCHVKMNFANGDVVDNDAEIFKPCRFIKFDSNNQKYVFYNSEKFVSFQDQWHIVGLPRNFICRILLLVLVKIAVPDCTLDMSSTGNNLSNNDQYELLFDLDANFKWDWDRFYCD